MKTTKLLALLLALLMVFSVILTACGPRKIEPGEDPGSHEHQNITNKGDENPEQTAQCTHAVTEKRNVKAATCLAEGYTGDDVCTACGEIMVAGTVIAKTACTYGEPYETLKPTCLRPGVVTYTCTVCLGTKSASVAPLGHNLQYTYADGETHSVTCANGCLYSEHQNHELRGRESTYAASCLLPAYKEGTCKICNEVYQVYDMTQPATGHTWGEWVIVDATCATVGSRTRTCSGCGETESVDIPVMENAHVWIEADGTIQATCQKAGLIKWDCQNPECDATRDDTVVARLPHALGEETVNNGFATQACTNAGCAHKVTRTVVVEGQTSTTVTSDAIKDNVAQGDAFEVKTDKVAIQFPADVVEQMTSGTESQDVAISADTLDEEAVTAAKENMSTEDKELFESTAKGTVYDFNASVGGTAFNKDNKFNAAVVITVPYTLALDDPSTDEDEGEDPDGIYIWYMADDGTIEKVLATFVCENEETGEGYVWFELEHFSRYAIAYEETQEIKCRKGIHVWANKGEPVEVGCANPGFQMQECTSCHKVDFINWVDPTGHNWETEVIDPTCTEPGCTIRECTACDAIETVVGSYTRPTGHTPSGEVSCDYDVVCTSCGDVLVKGGHEWSAWTTVVEPTEITNGLRRRNCSKCGKVEEIILAATGNVEQLEFSTYEEMLNVILGDVMGIEAGTLTFDLAANMDGTIATDYIYTISKENGKYVILMEATLTDSSYTETVKFLYRNGMFIDLSETDAVLAYSDMESQVMMPVSALMEYCEQLLGMIDEPVSMLFATGDELFGVLNDSFGTAIDAKLAANGSTATVADLKATLDSMRTVYAYAALKLGFTSSVTMVQGVELPTAADMTAVIEALMTKTENADGTVTYTWNPDALIADVKAVLNWVIDNKASTLGALIYEAIGADLVATYPELTNWDAVVTKLNTEFPGTMLVKDAVDKLLTVVETAELGTVADVYAMINELAVMFGADPAFDIETMITENYNLSLNELLANMTEPVGSDEVTGDPIYMTVADIFAVPGTMTLDDLPIAMIFGLEAAPSELAAQVLEMIESFAVTADVAYTVTADGKLVSFTLDQVLDMAPADEPAPTEEAEPLQSLTLTIVSDPAVAVEITDVVNEISNAKIESSYNANGDLVIKVPAGYEIDFSISGDGNIPLESMLTRDEAMSAEFGCDVYLANKGLWNDSMHVGSYVKLDGKYYEILKNEGGSVETVIWSKALSELTVADILPDTTVDTPFAIYTDANGVDHYAYETMMNPMVQLDGTWYMISRYSYMGGMSSDQYGWLEKISVAAEDIRPFTQTEVDALRYSNSAVWSDSRWAMLNDQPVKLNEVYLAIDTEDWGADYTIPVYTYFDENDNVMIAKYEFVSGQRYIILGDEIATLPAHDYMYEGKYDEDDSVILMNQSGEVLTGECTYVNLSASYPVYYVEAVDGIWVNVSQMSTMPAILNATLELPDGTVMYVTRSAQWYRTPEYDTVVYGWIKCGSLYAEAAALCWDGNVLDVRYNGMIDDTVWGQYDECFDVDSYITGDATNGYVVDADLLEVLGELCGENNGYSIIVTGTKTVGDVAYTFYASAGNSWNVGNLSFGGSASGNPETPIFGGSSSSGVKFEKNGDGTFSVYYVNYDGEATKIELSFGAEDRFPVVDEAFVKDEVMSEQTGLEIYKALISESSDQYILQDGKYYEYGLFEVWNPEYVTLSDAIANRWYINDLAYFCSTVYDENPDDDQPGTEPIDVYRARVGFYRAWGNTMTMYLAVMNDKVYVMLDAVVETESTIVYDDLQPASEFFDAAATTAVTSDAEWISRDIYINGQKVAVYGSNVTIGNSTISFYYTKDSAGNKQYIYDYDVLDWALELYDEVEPEDYYEIAIWEETNGYGSLDITFADVITQNYETYVKLADRYYTYSSYQSWVISADEYNTNHSARDWYYVCNDTYYNSVAYDSVNNCFVLSEPITELPTFVTGSESSNHYGYTENGDEIYQITGTLATGSDVRVETAVGDGTYFVHFEGDTKGYIKTQIGTYLEAVKVISGDSYYYDCVELYQDTLNDYALAFTGYFDDAIIFNELGNRITINSSILDLVPENLQDVFRIYINFVDEDGRHYNSEVLKYADIVSYLNDGFVDQEELEGKSFG